MTKTRIPNTGFTVIEILIALAIAGLIMLIVLLAVPALQRSRTDNARKHTALSLYAAVNTHIHHNQGNVSGFKCTAEGNCKNIIDPDTGEPPKVVTSGNIKATEDSGVLYRIGKGCVSGGGTNTSSQRNAFAISYWSASAGRAKCIDNSSHIF